MQTLKKVIGWIIVIAGALCTAINGIYGVMYLSQLASGVQHGPLIWLFMAVAFVVVGLCLVALGRWLVKPFRKSDREPK